LRVARRHRVAKSNPARWASIHIAVSGIVLTGLLLGVLAPVLAGTHRQVLTFSPNDLGFRKYLGYDVVSLHGARWLNSPGEPHLPLIPLRIALPAGCEVVGLAIVDADSITLAGAFSVWPSQPPRSLSWDRPPEIVEPLPDIYTSGEIYPGCVGEFVGWGRLRGATVCEIVVYPLRYVPVEERLILYTQVVIEVEYRWQLPIVGAGSGQGSNDILESLVTDGSPLWFTEEHQMHDAGLAPLGGDPVSYLIITRDSLRAYFEPLREWKTRKGIPACIVSIETIMASYPGGDLAAKVRACIADFHVNSGTDWVLLGGDTEIVPARKAYVSISDRPYIPCDLYYSDLDGTWNDDGDLYWGEVPADNIDMYSDVYLGRAPVAGRGQVRTFVDKVLTYEGFYPAPRDYQLDMLFMAEVLWGDPDDPDDPEYTDGGVAKNRIDNLYVPSAFAIEKLYESTGNLDYGAVMSQLNQGQNIINVLCHGQYTSISIAQDALTTADFANLVNGPRYGLMYSATCHSGGFDQNDCIGETWVLSPDGGGFFIGNSRYGFNCPGFPGEGPSDYYDQAFFESVFLTGFTNLGKAHADAKHEFVAESRSDSYMRYIMYGLNLLGDPETRLWTATPGSLEVACEASVAAGPQTYSVSVTSQGGPVAGAVVCLYKGTEVYCIDATDGAGSAGIFIDPASPGTLLVTVTKPTYLPFAGDVLVTDGECPQAPRQVTAEETGEVCVDLIWSAVGDPDLADYRIYRNTSPSPVSLALVPACDTTYTDCDVTEGNEYFYWVSSVDSSGNESELSEVCTVTVGGSTGVPWVDVADGRDRLVWPNPFTESVSLVFRGMPDTGCRMDVFDINGRRIGEVRPERIGDDRWGGEWEPRDRAGRKLPPGIYLVRFSSGSKVSTEKVILLD
jgi:hypothetical protein